MQSSSDAIDALVHRRIEVKFAMENMDLMLVRRLLNDNCARIEHKGPISVINTLYFDDDQLSAYHENKAGLDRRWKVRLRWYGEAEGDFYLEFKERHGNLSTKERFKVRLDSPIEALSFRELKKSIKAQIPRAAAYRFGERPDPIVLNHYHREYFYDNVNKIRLTLDSAIRCYDQLGRQRLSKRHPQALEGLVIVEAKMPSDARVSLDHALHPLKKRMTRSSKYVQCLEKLGWGIEG